jgi:CubicO group peptidase (beta-lactamase class C family)/heat shock protein HslJ
MKTKTLFIVLTLWIFVLSVSSCSTANEEQPVSMPEVTLEGTSWMLEAFVEGQVTRSLIGDTEITLQFGGGDVRGSAGCNDYGGAYTLERGALRIPQIDITEQLCLEPAGVMAQEQKYVEILRKVTAFIWDANYLTLKTTDGLGLRFISIQTTATVSQSGPTDPLELENFLDAYFAEQMSVLHVPGATFVLVKDGDIFFAKGYGYADLENRIPYDPDKTVFWAASVAKAFTAVGVLQLYDRGLIDLDSDVNQYLRDFQVANDYPKPVTFAHLLTHTDGFEARIGGDAARTGAEMRPLREVVQQHRPAQVAEPGRFLTYGNFATNLSGVLIEDASGLPFARYMDMSILQPLGMNRTTFEQILPSDWGPDLAIGYRHHNGVYEPQPYVYANLLPQGGMRSTAADIARFMIALLQGGNDAGSHVLNGPTVRLMFQQQFSSHPRLAGITYGLFELFRNDRRLLIRDGDGWGFRSRMVLMPEQNLGFFVNYNNEEADVLRDDLVSQFLDHYYPVLGQVPSMVSADFQGQADQYAGVYTPLQWDQTTFTKIALLFAYRVRVTANDDGTVTIVGIGDAYGGFEDTSRWREVEPRFFQQIDGDGYVAFGRDDQGRIAYLFSGQGYHGAYARLAWYETPALHLTVLFVAALLFLATLVAWPVSAWIHSRRGKSASVSSILSRLARWLAAAICALHILFIIGIALVTANPFELVYGIPPLLHVTLVLALLAVVMTVGLPVFTVLIWKDGYWSFWGRVHYTLLTVVVLAFTWWLDYWNLLGFRY